MEVLRISESRGKVATSSVQVPQHPRLAWQADGVARLMTQQEINQADKRDEDEDEARAEAAMAEDEEARWQTFTAATFKWEFQVEMNAPSTVSTKRARIEIIPRADRVQVVRREEWQAQLRDGESLAYQFQIFSKSKNPISVKWIARTWRNRTRRRRVPRMVMRWPARTCLWWI